MLKHVHLRALSAGFVVAIALLESTFADEPNNSAEKYANAMRQVHEGFHGAHGTFAQFGDSISVSLAFWAPLAEKPSKMSDELLQDWQIVHDHQRSECWSQWRGPEYGNEGGMTIRWADENVQQWLEKLNPEVAVIMFGTNDLGQLEAKEYEAKTRSVVERCLENGTIVILTTLPPRHGFDEKATKFADIVRSLADQLHVPLVDYHKAILDRRPDDWDGALEKFRDAPGDEYNVPTLIARDGVHPSYPGGYRDYSEESLDNNGYALRSVITMQRYAEVIRTVLAPK